MRASVQALQRDKMLSIRIILSIIGAIIIFGIIIDGLWRKKRLRSIQRHIHQQSAPQQEVIVEPEIAVEYQAESAEIVEQTETVALVDEGPQIPEEPKPELIKIEEAVDDLDDLIVLTVMADAGKKFVGFELLQALLKEGLKYGDMKIFHRHRHLNNNKLDNKSPVYFSVASVTQPGYFDIQHMPECETRGLSLFMSVPDVDDPADVFEIMFAAATQLANRLGGKVCDRYRRPLSDEMLAACRQRARINGSIFQ